MKINKRIEIVRSNISAYSSMSKSTSEDIVKILRAKYKKVDITLIESAQDLNAVIKRRPDLVLLTAKRIPILPNEQGGALWISDVLSEANINYTGSMSSAIALDYDKSRAKDVVLESGLATTRYFIAKPGEFISEQMLPIKFPLFIKPVCLGNKKGVDSDSVIHIFGGYTKKVLELNTKFKSNSLVEPYLNGREFSVSVFENHTTGQLESMPLEISVKVNKNGDKILGNISNTTEAQVLSKVIDSKLLKELKNLAEGVFKALGARDYGRIDIRLNKLGIPQFLEANLIPGLAKTNTFPSANEMYNGLNYEDTIYKVLETAFDRINLKIVNDLNIDNLEKSLNISKITYPELVLN